MDQNSPQATYQAEKEKAERERRLSHAELMAEAQAEFNKMLEDARTARKSGRPKKNPGAPPKPAPKPPAPEPEAAKPIAAASVASPAPLRPSGRAQDRPT